MQTRRKFLINASLALAACSIPASGCSGIHSAKFQPPRIRRALVVWNSQTGHTRQVAGIIKETLEKNGIPVTASDYRHVDSGNFATGTTCIL